MLIMVNMSEELSSPSGQSGTVAEQRSEEGGGELEEQRDTRAP